MCRVCYGFRNAPPEGFGALAYGITHPTYISKIKYDSYIFTNQIGLLYIQKHYKIVLNSTFFVWNIFNIDKSSLFNIRAFCNLYLYRNPV